MCGWKAKRAGKIWVGKEKVAETDLELGSVLAELTVSPPQFMVFREM